MSKERLLCVQGQGQASRHPDSIQLTLHVTATEKAFADAVAALNQKVSTLGDAVEKAGLDRTAFKAGDYRVEDRWGRHNKRLVRKGFEASLGLNLELALDFVLLGRFLEAIAASSAEPWLTFTFMVRDEEALRHEALAAAVADARKRAQTIAKGAGLTLGKIQHVEHSPDGYFSSRRSYRLERARQSSAREPRLPELTPEEISASASVTITWGVGASVDRLTAG